MTTPPSPAPATRMSPFDAVGEAIEHTKRSLFPFRFERWLALGFVAFLDQCGRSQGGSLRLPGPGGGGSEGGGGAMADMRAAAEWLASHVALVVGIATLVLALILALIALVLWINSRGVFMYVDNVATGRADVVRPWREHADRAGSLFAWRFVIAMVTGIGIGFLVGLAALLAFAYARERLAGGVALGLGLMILLPGFLVILVTSGIVSVALRDFVAPLQWRLGVTCGEAAAVLWPLVKAHPGSFGAYLLLKIVFSLAALIIILAAGCLTCCCGFLPVVCQTLLQPLFYFERAWSLVVLRQLGHDVFAPGKALAAIP